MKKQFRQLVYIGLLLPGVMGLGASGAIAQPEPAATPQFSVVSPRVGLRYNTEGAGFDPYVNFEGFIPIYQTPGTDVAFIDSRLILATPNSALGGNINLGYRFFDPTRTWIYGAYAAYDYRNTGSAVFNQIGLGLEGLSEQLDFRANGYLPVGTSRNLVGSGLSGANPQFQNNFLLLNRFQDFQVALSGFDAEVGTKLLALGDTGSLRGYVGGYYYGGEGIPGFAGLRSRLVARPNQNSIAALTLTTDSRFDTRLTFSIGVSLSPTPSNHSAPASSQLALLNGNVERQPSILVANQRVSNRITATNPATNQPFRFLFVVPGATGTGTAENPAGSVATVINAQPNDIIYARGGNDPGGFVLNPNVTLGGFAPAGGISLITNSIARNVNTVEAGAVQLPGSGAGGQLNFTGPITLGTNRVLSGPQPEFAFNGGIVMGNNSTLTGLTVQNIGTAVLANGVNNFTIANNILRSQTTEGIRLQNVTGTSTVTGNQVLQAADGIIVVNASGTTTVANNAVNDATNRGIVATDLSSAANVAIQNNTVNRSGAGAIALSNVAGTTALTNNTINNAGADAIALRNITGTANVTGNAINTAVANGIVIDGATGTLNITNNAAINNVGANGISLNNLSGTTTVTGNAVNTAGARGIAGTSFTGGTTTIASNTVTQTQAEGISIGAVATSATVNVTGSTLNNVGTDAVAIRNVAGTVNVSNNPINTAASNGIVVDGATGTVNVTNNTAINNVGANGVSLSNLSGTTTVTDNVINTPVARGVTGTNFTAGTATISRNTINGSGADGIALEQVAGTVIVTDNRAIGTAGSSMGNGIQVTNSSGTSTLVVDNNTVENYTNSSAGQGINMTLAGTAGLDSTAQITNNTISNVSSGIGVSDNSSSSKTFTLTGNRITNASIAGMNLQLGDGGGTPQSSFTVDNNTITNTTGTGLSGLSFTVAGGAQASALTITNNQISNIGPGAAIGVTTADTANLTLAIVGSTIDNASTGIDIAALGNSVITGNSFFNSGIQNNTITNIASNGISVLAIDTAEVQLEIGNQFDAALGNRISNPGGDGINITLATNNDNIPTVSVFSNSIQTTGGSGIAANVTNSSTNGVTLQLGGVNIGNDIDSTTGDGIQVVVGTGGVADVQIVENRIGTATGSSIGGSGISVSADGGTILGLTVGGADFATQGNVVSNSAQDGIRVRSTTGTSTIQNTSIQGNDITQTTGTGISVGEPAGTGTLIPVALIRDNAVIGTGGESVNVTNVANVKVELNQVDGTFLVQSQGTPQAICLSIGINGANSGPQLTLLKAPTAAFQIEDAALDGTFTTIFTNSFTTYSPVDSVALAGAGFTETVVGTCQTP